MYLLHFTWVKWNEFSGSHYFLRLLTNTTSCTVSLRMQVSFLFFISARICSKNLWFDRKNLEILLVNAGHVKGKGDCKPDSFEQTILIWAYQFVIFNSWKVRWNSIDFSQNSFVISPGLLYHLIRRDTGRLVNEAFTSILIISSKQ